MSLERVTSYFKQYHIEDRIQVFDDSSATVADAAHALHCEPGRIAKTLLFLLEDQPILIVTAGDARIDNKKYKQFFHKKAKMIPSDQVEALIGHAPGGVCPFAIPDTIPVYLDESLRAYDVVYPACGNGHSAIALSLPELEQYANTRAWIDVCQ